MYWLLRSFVHLPQRKGIALRIQADGKVAHPRYSGLRFADRPAEFLDLRRCLGNRWDTDIVRDRLLRVHARHHTAIR